MNELDAEIQKLKERITENVKKLEELKKSLDEFQEKLKGMGLP